MQGMLSLGILLLYESSLFVAGWGIVRKLVRNLPFLFLILNAFLIGHVFGIPLTYVFSCLFSKTDSPILWSSLATIVVASILSYFLLIRDAKESKFVKQSLSVSDILVVIFSLIFSFWLMNKTFHGGSGGLLFVGSNNVFDFGHAIGLMRSMSWGGNIPFRSPFFAGGPFFYHFLFLFWTALWEFFGVPIVLAVNIPSILSFAAFLISVYLLPQLLFKQGKLTGWIAIFLTITNSTLTFWMFLLKNGFSIQTLRSLWRLPTYPFAGPYDGSTISIYMTLNNYVNQRHLAFSIAVALSIIMLYFYSKKRQMVFLGFLTGLLLLWNIAVCFLTGGIIFLFTLTEKKWGEMFWFVAACAFGIFISIIPYLSSFVSAVRFLTVLNTPTHSSGAVPSWGWFSYLWMNLGILPLFLFLRFWALSKPSRRIAAVFLFLFCVLCLVAVFHHRGFDQKFLSFLIIPMNGIAGASLVWLWGRKHFVVKTATVVLFVVLTISGVVDLMAVKNEFAYPFVEKDTAPLIFWIRDHTPKNAVFVSYSDMIDPVVLAGRTNFFGFFGNVGWYDRSATVARIYSGDTSAARANNISYVLVPKWQKSDFPYLVDEQKLTNNWHVVYEDARFQIFKTDEYGIHL